MRTVAVVVAALVGLVLAALVVRAGWQVPVRMECPPGGDVCYSSSWFDVDWQRVNWELKPARIACFEPNPDDHAVIIGPGEECVRARGDGVILRSATYEQLQDEFQRRRVLALLLAAAMVLLPPLLTYVLVRRRRSPLLSGAGG